MPQTKVRTFVHCRAYILVPRVVDNAPNISRSNQGRWRRILRMRVYSKDIFDFAKEIGGADITSSMKLQHDE